MQDYLDGKEGEVVMVNGLENPALSIRPGQVQRWRIVNASTARYYNLHLEGHSLYLIGTDGGLLDKPYPVSRLLLVPGERVELLVHADKGPGDYKFVSLPYDRQRNRLEKVTLLTLSCKGRPARDRIPRVINPHARRLKIDPGHIRKRRKIYFIMANGRGMINVKDYDIDPYVITSEVGTYEIWEIVNISPMDHPFHHHTNPCQILDITGGDTGYAGLYPSIPAWKDTFNVPFKGSATILVPIKDFSGKAVFHCHIFQHEDIGMMGIWEMV
jgi:FtsP/CotA-like multicopper oxidase with cupredoxin domain